MSTTTREQFIAAAEKLFAVRGFYGTSIAAIATELGLTKQALLHHFGNKEKLYGEVLLHISRQLQRHIREAPESDGDPVRQLEELVLAQYRLQMSDPDSSRLIMRELLDNEQRAEKAGNWYLKPYLETLVDRVLAVQPMDKPQALALVYQLLGAVHYFAVSQPTLASMFGAALLEETRANYEQALRQLIRARLQHESHG